MKRVLTGAVDAREIAEAGARLDVPNLAEIVEADVLVTAPALMVHHLPLELLTVHIAMAVKETAEAATAQLLAEAGVREIVRRPVIMRVPLLVQDGAKETATVSV